MFKKALSLMLVSGLIVGSGARADAGNTIKLVGSLLGAGGLAWAGDALHSVNEDSFRGGADAKSAALKGDLLKAVLIPGTVALGCYLYTDASDIPSYLAKITLFTATYFAMANDPIAKFLNNSKMSGGLFTDGVDASGKERPGYSRYARVVLTYVLAKELIKYGLKGSSYSRLLD